jgi:hypothetical protein
MANLVRVIEDPNTDMFDLPSAAVVSERVVITIGILAPAFRFACKYAGKQTQIIHVASSCENMCACLLVKVENTAISITTRLIVTGIARIFMVSDWKVGNTHLQIDMLYRNWVRPKLAVPAPSWF